MVNISCFRSQMEPSKCLPEIKVSQDAPQFRSTLHEAKSTTMFFEERWTGLDHWTRWRMAVKPENDFWTAGQKNDRRHVEPRVKLYGCQATNTWMVAGKPYWRQLEQWMVAGELSGPWTAVTQFTILSDTLPDQYAWAAGGWQKFKQHQSPIFFRPEIWSSMSIQRSSMLPDDPQLMIFASIGYTLRYLVLRFCCSVGPASRKSSRRSSLEPWCLSCDTDSWSWTQVESSSFWHTLANHAPNCLQRPVCHTCSCSADQFCQHRRPFCLPLAIVPAQVPKPLHRSMHVPRRCAWSERFLCDLLRSRLWLSTLPMEESLRTDLADLHVWILVPQIVSWYACSPSIALSVSTHFVSTGVTWYCAIASRSWTFSYTPRSRRYFNPCSRALRTACHGNSLLVTSSMHMTSCSSSSTSANIACFSRLRLAIDFTIDLHNFSSFSYLISSAVLKFSTCLFLPHILFVWDPAVSEGQTRATKRRNRPSQKATQARQRQTNAKPKRQTRVNNRKNKKNKSNTQANTKGQTKGKISKAHIQCKNTKTRKRRQQQTHKKTKGEEALSTNYKKNQEGKSQNNNTNDETRATRTSKTTKGQTKKPKQSANTTAQKQKQKEKISFWNNVKKKKETNWENKATH